MISHQSYCHKTIIDKNRFKTMHRESSKRMLKQTSTPYLANPMEPYHPNSPRSRLPEPDLYNHTEIQVQLVLDHLDLIISKVFSKLVLRIQVNYINLLLMRILIQEIIKFQRKIYMR